MRKPLFTATGIIGALTLAACGGGSNGDGGDSDLVIWHMESTPERVAAWEALAEDYNATDPEQQVSIQVQEWDEVYQSIAAAAQSGTQPDVLFTIPDFTTYVRGLGLGQPVTDVVEELDAEHGFIEAATAPYTDDEELWAVPLYGMVQMLWYRGDMFDEAGLEAPETWDELLAAAETLTDDGVSGIALPAGQNQASDQVVYSFMLTGGAGNFFTEDEQIDFDTQETIAAFELYNELLEYSPGDSAGYAWAEPQAAFNSGSAAMAVEKGQYLAPFEAESGLSPEDLGCAPIPVSDEGGEPGSIYYSNGAMVLSEEEEQQEGAADFLAWLLEDDNYGPFLNAEPGLFLPVTEEGSELESWRSDEVVGAYDECVDAMLDQSQSGDLFGFVEGQYVDYVGEISGQNILAQVVQQMYVNDMSPEEAVEWGQEQMEGVVE